MQPAATDKNAMKDETIVERTSDRELTVTRAFNAPAHTPTAHRPYRAVARAWLDAAAVTRVSPEEPNCQILAIARSAIAQRIYPLNEAVLLGREPSWAVGTNPVLGR